MPLPELQAVRANKVAAARLAKIPCLETFRCVVTLQFSAAEAPGLRPRAHNAAPRCLTPEGGDNQGKRLRRSSNASGRALPRCIRDIGGCLPSSQADQTP